MPTLEWIGKDKVINHHQEVPFRVLEKKYTVGADESDNLIIRGDNLEALKALLPRYEGRVKCVYIDPPYNTGNEGWVYNDNVNDPRIRRWLGAVVGKEGEDLSRHDKWLCMMYPRLRLLHRLLSPAGAIFISIDDAEYSNLKAVCDEIFGPDCFVSNISWQRTYSTRNDSKGIVNEVEHILTYSRRPGWNPNKLPRTEEMNALYKNPDNDTEPWASDNPFAPGAATHQGMVYAIQHPFTGEMIYPTNGRCWTFGQDQMLEIMSGWTAYKLQDLHDEEARAIVCGVSAAEVRPGVQAIVLAVPPEKAAADARKVYKRGQWPRFYFTKGGKGGIRRKTYLENVGGKPPTNLWTYAETGHTDEAKKEMLSIFDGRATFDTPKPRRLVEFVLKIASDPDSIILDSFAGSGTTAHAVLNINKADGGRRRFILVEMMDYAESITAERVRRVINGYGSMEGTGGDFTFCELGSTVMTAEGLINPETPTERLMEYVWYTETRQPWAGSPTGATPWRLGLWNGTEYYFYYEPDRPTALDEAFLRTLPAGPAARVIYADICTLSAAKLKKYGVLFKKIPRDITKV